MAALVAQTKVRVILAAWATVTTAAAAAGKMITEKAQDGNEIRTSHGCTIRVQDQSCTSGFKMINVAAGRTYCEGSSAHTLETVKPVTDSKNKWQVCDAEHPDNCTGLVITSGYCRR